MSIDTSVVLRKRHNNDAITPKSYEIQSQWFPIDLSGF